MRTQRIPYLPNAEENELKRLKTTADEGFLAMKNFGPQRHKKLLCWVSGRRGSSGIRIQIRGFLML
jgi:hypothetical protein